MEKKYLILPSYASLKILGKKIKFKAQTSLLNIRNKEFRRN